MDTVDNGICDTGWLTAAQATTRTLTGLTDGTYVWQVRATTAAGPAPADGGTWGRFTIDAPDPIREYIYLGDRLLAALTLTTATPVLTYYHTDVLGSVRAVTSATGAPLARHDYFPFGESTSPLTGDPRRFTGKERDAETALDYFEARYYRNVWGRFTTADDSVFLDPADPQTFNRYAYVFNNPLRWVDPTGHQAQPPLRFTDAVTVTATAPSDCFVLCEPEENGALTLTFALQNRELYRLGRGRLPLGEMGDQFARFWESPAGELVAILPPGRTLRTASGPLRLLGKYFASQAGFAQLLRGGGRIIVDADALRSAGRLAQTYGGRPDRWVKVTSTVPGYPQIHAYRNLDTGHTVEYKTIVGKLP